MPTDLLPSCGPIGMVIRHEDISSAAEWRVERPSHSIIVHLGGEMHAFEAEIEGAGHVTADPNPGAVYVVPAGCRYASAASGGLIRYAVIHLETSAGDEPPLALAPFLGSQDQFLLALVHRLGELADDRSDVGAILRESLGRSVRLHARHRFGAPAAATPKARAWLPRRTARLAAEHIEDNLDETISLDRLAALTGLSINVFIAAFRARFGATPAQYIIDRRLARAETLLRETRLSITEIALAAGFSSHSHLSATFRKRRGVAPSALRA